MIFFWIYDVCRIFFNITLELLCVFRNTEYNVSKYANFSLYRFINYCEFKIIIAFENRFQTMYIQARSWGGGGGGRASLLGGSGGMLLREILKISLSGFKCHLKQNQSVRN